MRFSIFRSFCVTCFEMAGTKRSSWPSSSMIVSFIVVLLCLGEFIRVELLLKNHVSRIRELESTVQTKRRQHVESTTSNAQNDEGQETSRIRRHQTINVNVSSSKIVRELERIQRFALRFCAVTMTDKHCRAGPPGPPGRPGHRGRRGKRGPKGDMGMPGRFGKQGIMGPLGPKGEKGNRGVQGPRGMRGSKGDPGRSITSPDVIISPSSLVVNEGQTAILKCWASGNPKPVIGWNKVGTSSQLTGDDKLVIPNVTPSDTGSYKCHARNLLGTAQQTVRITVQFRPGILIHGDQIFEKEGNNVTLPECLVTGFPSPNISWSRASRPLPKARTITNGGKLSLLKVRRNDSDTYICQAENVLGSTSRTVQLIIVKLPTFVKKPPTSFRTTVSESFSLNCTARSDPAPRISWRKLNATLPPGRRSEVRGGTLTIRRAEIEDSGVYICNATSAGVSSVEAATQVTVIRAADCSEIYKSGVRQNGVYTIYPDSTGPFQVYCDMTTDGGGWTVFQRRQDGSVDFYRTWDEYKTGFGNLHGEFWLGNDKIHRLTSRTASMLRVELEDWDGVKVYAKYGSFSVGSEGSKYRLSVTSYSGTAGDSLSYHNSMAFTTKDNENDLDHVNGNCAHQWKGAWWYNSCHESNLNGKYLGRVNDNQGIAWSDFRSDLSLKYSEIKLKPSS